MKRLLSLLVTISILFSFAAVTVTARDSEEYPFVLIRGMDFTGLTVNYGTDEAAPCINTLDTSAIGEALKDCFKGFIFGGSNGAVKALCDFVRGILGNMGMNPDGTSTYNVSLDTYPLAVSNYPEMLSSLGNTNEDGIIKGAVDRYGADNCYYFVYDWRFDPYYTAQGVESIIEQAKLDHNSDKVNLVCCSMGGAVTVAYLSEYTSADLNKVVFLSSAFDGTYVASDVLQGNVYVGADELYNFAVDKFPDYKNALTFLQKTFMLKIASGIINKFIGNYKDVVFDYLLRDIFGTMPGFWAIVQPDDYEACIDCIFPTDELKSEYSVIIGLSEKYQQMWANRDSIFAQSQANGTFFSVVATYDIPLIPVYDRAATNGDGTLETAPMLGGATVANYGETLYETYGKDYKPGDIKYVSPDNVIDMSTAIFPDYTWCFKDVPHISCCYQSEMQEFLFWLIDFDGQPTIYSDARYPQYMLSSYANDIRYFD